MSLTTLAPKTRLPEHSTGWAVLRVVRDRAGKYLTEGPADWGKHRALTAAEKVQAFALAVNNAFTYRATRP